jgi:hypothetical protein
MVTAEIAAYIQMSQAPVWVGIAQVAPVIRIWGGVSDSEITLILVAMMTQNQLSGCDSFEALVGQITAKEPLILAGGIRISDGKRTIEPGCCCGVEDWREQIGLLVEGDGWMGHDPAPWARIDGDHVEVWSDGGLESPPSHDGANVFSIRVPKQIALTFEAAIHRDLAAFLDALGRWAESKVGQVAADALVAKLSSVWRISRVQGSASDFLG